MNILKDERFYKFLIPSLIGAFLFVTPINQNGSMTIPIAVAANKLLDLMGDFRTRAVEVMLRVKELNAEAAAIKAEMDVLAERMKSRTTRAENLTKYVMDAMTSMGIDRIEDPRAKLIVRTNPESVQLADKAAFIAWAKLDGRADLLKFAEPTAALSAIKNALKSGEEIPGASIVRTKRLEVK